MAEPANPHWDALWTNVHLATLTADADGYGEIRDVWQIADGRLYVKFDGLTLWRPNNNEPFRPFKAAA